MTIIHLDTPEDSSLGSSVVVKTPAADVARVVRVAKRNGVDTFTAILQTGKRIYIATDRFVAVEDR